MFLIEKLQISKKKVAFRILRLLLKIFVWNPCYLLLLLFRIKEKMWLKTNWGTSRASIPLYTRKLEVIQKTSISSSTIK